MPIELARIHGHTVEVEYDDPFCLRPGEAKRLLQGHRWTRFVVLGDSVAEGVGDPVEGYSPLPWCDRIATELEIEQYVNLGASHLTARGVRESQLGRAAEQKPDLSLVVCGGNDALRKSYDPDAVDAELVTIINALKRTGADVITVGVFDVSHAPSFPDKVKAQVSAWMQLLSARTAALAAACGTIHVNCTGHPAESDPAMYSSDGLHGNLRSHAICAAITIRRLGAHLAQRRS